ncbi:beta-glucosidase BglX [Microvirga sp. STR05]|uniref:Beta-glucosidase BglX n=1 Tax=Hymenobacter duratus TaxID=2771356 RepID=A0ABR8JDC7_9BACT|nr:beta-glucosidase BglX [Hymenobacter duratus]MBD2714027.1 beta-glucosidase BglX [Hymenobacter duratus]MBR7948929.1 beta-glucosidase BglX [Microvirga sp. STR05]
MKRVFRNALFMSLGLLTPQLQAQTSTPTASASTPDPKMTRFIDDLMQKMTLEEKIGQLNMITVGFDVTGPVVSKDVDASIRKGNVGSVLNTFTPTAARKLQEMAVKDSRLHIPLFFGYDVIHGHRTIFPIALGLASSWDLTAIERSARIAAEEASADGINWVYSPMVDISRDPRWGRVSEGSGEDPYLGSQIARVMVRGYQGDDLSRNNTVMACVKHFALYGAAEAGRDYNTTDMSPVRMYNEYLPPYKAAVEAGAASMMSSFNDINGVPATGNKWLMTELLRNQWGFQGFVATDYTAINEMTAHGMGNDAQVSALALNAGIDQDMVGEIFLKNLAQNLKDGTVKQERIDVACRRILEAKWKLGLFKDPYLYTNEKRAKATMMKKEFIADARDIARKSMVLLKNSNNTLPLKKTGTIALIGPLATRQHDMLGSWSAAGDWKQAVSLEQGMKNAVGSSVKIVTAQGANFTDDQQLIDRLNAYNGGIKPDTRTSEALIQEAVQLARSADVVVAAVGESQGMSGEAASRADIGLPGQQLELLKALKKTGKPLVLVLMSGRPLALPWEDKNADAILETWFAGSQAGNAIADVLFGAYNPSGKLTATFPQSVGQIPLYYNHKMTGRPYVGQQLDKYKSRYLDVSNEPLYPFGYGLSYTTFQYGKPELSTTTLPMNGTLEVTVTVQNTGSYDGEEVAQLYIRDMVGSISRPVKELKGFQKVLLKKGESRTLTFRLTPEDLKFYNADLKFVAEPGDFQVFVGGNSRDVQMATFTLGQN